MVLVVVVVLVGVVVVGVFEQAESPKAKITTNVNTRYNIFFVIFPPYFIGFGRYPIFPQETSYFFSKHLLFFNFYHFVNSPASNSQYYTYTTILCQYTQQAKSGLQGTEELSTNLNAWLSYERRIKEVPDWPYTASILRSLIASTAVPAAVYVFKVLTGVG